MKISFPVGLLLLLATLIPAGSLWQGWRNGKANLSFEDAQVKPDAALQQVWRSATTGEGKSSPVIAEGRVFYTSAKLENALLARLHTAGIMLALLGLSVLFCANLASKNAIGLGSVLHLPFIVLGCPLLLAEPVLLYESRNVIVAILLFFVVGQCSLLLRDRQRGGKAHYTLLLLVVVIQVFALTFYALRPARHSLLQAIFTYELAVVALLQAMRTRETNWRNFVGGILDELHQMFALFAIATCLICFWDLDLMWAQSQENQRWARASGPLLLVLAFGMRKLAAQGVSIRFLATAALAITLALVYLIPQVALSPLGGRSIAYLSLILPSAVWVTYKVAPVREMVRQRLANVGISAMLLAAPVLLFATSLRTFAANNLVYHVECLALRDGQHLWTRKLPSNHVRLAGWKSSNATATPLIAGNNLIVAFNDVIAAYDLAGNLRWQRQHPPNGSTLYAQSASPILYEDSIVLLRAEERADEQDAVRPQIERIGLARGERIWCTDVPAAHNSYGTPIRVPRGEREMLVFAGWEQIYCVDPQSGAVIEEVPIKSREVSASLTVAGPHQIFLAGGTVSGPSIMFSLSPDKPARILWQTRELAKVVASPIALKNRILALDGDGELMALNTADGQVLERLELSAQTFSSPIALGERLYIFDSSGTGHVLRHTPKLDVLATTKIEPVYATPAVASQFLIVRSEAAIYCFWL